MGCAQSSCRGAGEDGKSRLHALVHEKKVMRNLLLVVLMGRAQSRRRRKEAGVVGEANDGWLLADSPAAGSGDGAGAGAESHSVHSSFRFSFGSRVEVESFGLGSPVAAAAEATVLMVNLEKSSAGSPGGGSSRVRQVELLDRSVSSVDTRLIRFSYAEICSATQNFCRGLTPYPTFFVSHSACSCSTIKDIIFIKDSSEFSMLLCSTLIEDPIGNVVVFFSV